MGAYLVVERPSRGRSREDRDTARAVAVFGGIFVNKDKSQPQESEKTRT